MKSISFYLDNCLEGAWYYKGHQFVLGKVSKTWVFLCWVYSFDLAARGRSSAIDQSSEFNTIHHYSLRSLLPDQLVLHSPLRIPRRPRRHIMTFWDSFWIRNWKKIEGTNEIMLRWNGSTRFWGKVEQRFIVTRLFDACVVVFFCK